jgi:pilus assembly protein CpaE
MAANLAWHLANRQSRRVALVDLDLHHGDCALTFNINITPGFRDALANPLRLDHLLLDRIMTQHGERLFVLGSEEPLHENMQFTVPAIDALFSVLRSQFHYVIVDVPRTSTPANRRALEIADRQIIVVDQTMRAMRDAVRLAKLFGGEGDSAEHSTLFVVNRVGEFRQHAVSMKDIQKVLQVPPTSLVPFLPSLVAPSVHQGLVAASKRGKFADAVAVLALELSGRKRKQSWWRRAAK